MQMQEALLRVWVVVSIFVCATVVVGCSNSTAVAPFNGGAALSQSERSTQGTSNARALILSRKGHVAPGTYELVYSFKKQDHGAVDAAGPLSIGSDGTVYGTTPNDWVDGQGLFYDGTVFELSSGSGSFSVVHKFDGGDGMSPMTGVIEDSDGALYGTTPIGGTGGAFCSPSYGCGVLFRLTRNGSTWSEKTLHVFGSKAADGQYPSGPLLLYGGKLYGVTNGGGPYVSACAGWDGECGTIYRIGIDGSGYTILYNFTGGSNTNFPSGPLATDGDGNLYGTTDFGGSTNCDSIEGCGAVYEISTSGSGFSLLYTFTGVDNGDGAQPQTGVTVVGDSLYGTTASGGRTGCAQQGYNPVGCGVIFELTGNEQNAWTESVLHKFAPTDGQSIEPSGLLLVGGTDLYGTSSYGGDCSASGFPYGCGTVFEITTAGNYSTVHQFQGPPTDAAFPMGGTPAGEFITGGGGSGSINPNFTSAGSGAALGVDETGTIWGATYAGGSGTCPSGCGAVYQLSNGSGSVRRR